MNSSGEDAGRDWRHRLHGGRLWLADLLRLPLAAIYWNTRKTAFTLRQRRGHCPCHDPSDSGAAGQTRCVAVLHWHSPARFQRVCPLLTRTDHGWCCAAGAKGVRPFWGRVLFTGAVVAVLLYVTGTLAAMGILRQVGFDQVRYVDVIWPGNWGRFQSIQARHYRQVGDVALRQGEYRHALMAYGTAMEIAPDLQLGISLAVLASYAGNYAYSDSLFIRLRHEFPAQHEQTAVAFHDQLLGSLRLRRLAELSLDGLNHSDRAVLPWVRLLLFAAAEGRFAPDLLRQHPDRCAQLPAAALTLLRADALSVEGHRVEAQAELEKIRPADGLWFYVAAVEAMVRAGQLTRAQNSLYARGNELPEFERAYLQYLITQARGDAELAQGDFLPLLRLARDPVVFDRLCGLLIQTKDGASLARLWTRHSAWLGQAAARRELSAIWVAARVCGQDELEAEIAARSAGADRSRLQARGRIDFLANRPGDPTGLRFLLATNELPRETILALVAESVRLRLEAANRAAGRLR